MKRGAFLEIKFTFLPLIKMPARKSRRHFKTACRHFKIAKQSFQSLKVNFIANHLLRKLFACLLDSNGNGNGHTNHGVVTYICGARNNRQSMAFLTPKHTDLCVLICSVLTLVDEMWTRICPHLLYHILSTLSSVRFSSLHYTTKHEAFPILLIVGHDKTTERKDFHG